MPSFDLSTEPWLPVLDAGADLRDGPDRPLARRDVGLREALLRAHEIREVYTDAPIETIALNRLLLAIFIDGFLSEPDEEAWRTLWERGRLDPDAVERYFNDPVRADRFDLLHPERPFYQHPVPLAKEPAPLSKLFHAEGSGNNATLFGHEVDQLPSLRSLAEAARGVVCAQAAAVGGGVSKPFNFSHGPLVGSAVFWIRGRSLFEALLLNAPPDPDARMRSGFSKNNDEPAWQRPLPNVHARRPVAGYLDYLTWQSRRLTLVPETDENGRYGVRTVYLTQGDKDDPGVTNDPLMATVVPQDKSRPPFPYGFRVNRVLWRDATTFFKLFRPEDGGSPRTFWWLHEFAGEDGDADPFAVDVFGLTGDKAKVLFWRHERMPVYPSLLAEDASQGALRFLSRALEFAEEQHNVLNGAVRTTAEYLLSPPKPGTDEAPKADKKAVTSLTDALGASGRYWASLEPDFYRLLQRLAAAPDDDARQACLWEWAETLFSAARTAFNQATAHLDEDARQLRAVAEGGRRLVRVQEYRAYRDTP